MCWPAWSHCFCLGRARCSRRRGGHRACRRSRRRDQFKCCSRLPPEAGGGFATPLPPGEGLGVRPLLPRGQGSGQGGMLMFAYYLELAIRSLKRNRLLTVLMVLAIAIGIGASMTTLTVMHLLSGDPLPGKSAHIFYAQVRSEERRVGKECGSRWETEH